MSGSCDLSFKVDSFKQIHSAHFLGRNRFRRADSNRFFFAGVEIRQ